MNKQEVFAQVIEKYKDTCSAFDDMSIDEVCARRYAISKELKLLEAERKEADELIMDYLSEPELKRGVATRNGGMLKVKRRTSWKFPDHISEEIRIIKKGSIDTGEAEERSVTFIVATDS